MAARKHVDLGRQMDAAAGDADRLQAELAASMDDDVNADLLSKLGRLAEARVEFERAAALTRNARLRDRLLARVAGCASARG